MSDSVIYVENLVKRYKELIALDHFNLDIKRRNFRAFRSQWFR